MIACHETSALCFALWGVRGALGLMAEFHLVSHSTGKEFDAIAQKMNFDSHFDSKFELAANTQNMIFQFSAEELFLIDSSAFVC